MSSEERKIIEEKEIEITPFSSTDALISALSAEIKMLEGFAAAAESLKSYHKPGQAEFVWFEAWVERICDLKEQAEHWVACLKSGDVESVVAELSDEKRILSGLIGMTHTALMTDIDREETDFLVTAYRQDFRRTRKNIVNALETVTCG